MTTQRLHLLLTPALAALIACGGPQETPDEPPTRADATATATAIPAGELEKVVMLLSAHEFEASREAVAQATSQPEVALLHISQDGTRTESIRLRAFESLSLYPSEQVRAAYIKRIEGGGAARMRHRAVTGFAAAWPDEAPEVLGAVLQEDDDPQVRLTAAVALSSCCGEAGRSLIRTAAEAEQEEWMRDKLRGYLKPKPVGPSRVPPPGLR